MILYTLLTVMKQRLIFVKKIQEYRCSNPFIAINE